MDLVDDLEVSLVRRRLYGLYPALVTSIKDPAGQGRVKVKLPWSPDGGGDSLEVWARLAVLLAGPNRGTWFVPDPNDEVLVGFEGGDPRRPFVIGALWNGSDAPPEKMDKDGNNFKKAIRSRNGVKVTLDDTDDQESLTLETPGGQSLKLTDADGSVNVRDSNGNVVTLAPAGVSVTAAGRVTVDAREVEVKAGRVTVKAGQTTFSGVVKADTVITNSIVASTYSPGVGNIL